MMEGIFATGIAQTRQVRIRLYNVVELAGRRGAQGKGKSHRSWTLAAWPRVTDV